MKVNKSAQRKVTVVNNSLKALFPETSDCNLDGVFEKMKNGKMQNRI